MKRLSELIIALGAGFGLAWGVLGLLDVHVVAWDTPIGPALEARIRALEAVTCEQHPEPAAPETCACAGETP